MIIPLSLLKENETAEIVEINDLELEFIEKGFMPGCIITLFKKGFSDNFCFIINNKKVAIDKISCDKIKVKKIKC